MSLALPIRRFDAIVVGAGGSGMRAALELAQKQGMDEKTAEQVADALVPRGG